MSQRERIRKGDTVEHPFTVNDDAMKAFQALSGDMSLIHTDKAFAESRGYKDVIVYGGLMLAHLSHVVGEMSPGKHGASVKWTITYRAPLYIGERACLRFEVMNVSASMGLVQGRFNIMCGDTLIAEGETQSIVPLELIYEPEEAAGAS